VTSQITEKEIQVLWAVTLLIHVSYTVS
jgi:hypothetical protein